MENIFRDAIKELEELIIDSKNRIDYFTIKYGKDSEQVKNHLELIEGFNLRMRQTYYLAEKIGINI